MYPLVLQLFLLKLKQCNHFWINVLRREAVHLPMGGMWAEVLAVGRAVQTQAHSHRREEVCLRGVQSPVHALRPPGEARQAAHQGRAILLHTAPTHRPSHPHSSHRGMPTPPKADDAKFPSPPNRVKTSPPQPTKGGGGSKGPLPESFLNVSYQINDFKPILFSIC